MLQRLSACLKLLSLLSVTMKLEVCWYKRSACLLFYLFVSRSASLIQFWPNMMERCFSPSVLQVYSSISEVRELQTFSPNVNRMPACLCRQKLRNQSSLSEPVYQPPPRHCAPISRIICVIKKCEKTPRMRGWKYKNNLNASQERNQTQRTRRERGRVMSREEDG